MMIHLHFMEGFGSEELRAFVRARGCGWDVEDMRSDVESDFVQPKAGVQPSARSRSCNHCFGLI